jgi:hypothetical protein
VIAYARDFAADPHHGEGKAESQRLDFYDGPQLLYRATSSDKAWLEVPLEVTKKEPLRLLLNATKAGDYGKYQASLNGVKLGQPLDFYSEKIADQECHLLDFWPEPGRYTLRLDCVGKNPRSEGYYCGLESVRLRERRPRVAEFGFDKAKDWREKPTLHR